MTLRMPPWEAERIANALEYARMLTATEPKLKPWLKSCAARIKAAVKAEKKRRETKHCCRTCKWLAGAKTLNPNCIKLIEPIYYPEKTRCVNWELAEEESE